MFNSKKKAETKNISVIKPDEPKKNEGDKKPDEKITPLGFDQPAEDLKTPSENITTGKTKTMLEINEMSVENYERSEQVINEIRIQKGCSREEAVRILTNPTPHK